MRCLIQKLLAITKVTERRIATAAQDPAPTLDTRMTIATTGMVVIDRGAHPAT
jgi:hypothetical protein